MVSSTCLHFLCLTLDTTPALLKKIFKPDLPSSSSITPGIPACGIQPILFHSADHHGEIIAVGMIITQSQQDSQNKKGTQQEQEEHTAHLGISNSIHAGRVLKVLEHKVKCHPECKMDWR